MASEGRVANRRGVLRRGLRVRMLAAAIAAIGAPGALANPGGAQVVQGTAALRQEGSRLTVTTSNGAVIHWDRFSIGSGETTRFVQPDAASQVLNRVVGGTPSEILGRLESNGRVFLINPSGVAFGRGAQVDVGALVVSTLKLSDQDFGAGRLQFGGSAAENRAAGAIRNDGVIRTVSGGTVYLVAPRIENAGLIHTPEGQVLLAAGHRVSIVNPRSPEVAWEVAAPASTAVNLGEIVARQIVLHGQIVRNGGTLQASSAVVGEDGRIVLRAQRRVEQAPDGRMSATGVDAQGRVRGGEIDIQAGEQVSLQGKVEAAAPAVATAAAASAGAVVTGMAASQPVGASTPIAAAPGLVTGSSLVSQGPSLERSRVGARPGPDGKVGDAPSPVLVETPAAGARVGDGEPPAAADTVSLLPVAAAAAPRPDVGADRLRRVAPVAGAPVGTDDMPRRPSPSPPVPQPDPRHAIAGGAAGTGGRVRVLAREIVLGEGLVLDASGPAGGGTVLIGGELQGASAGGPNALNVLIDAGARLTADATAVGTGGRIIVWADDSTRVHGAISARGGPQGGDGGFIETSGRRVLTVTRPADASAPQGRAGEWLLDPYNVFIRAGSGAPPPGGVFSPDGDDSVITTGAIEAALNLGTSVTITTGTAGAQAGDITLEAPITAASTSLQQPTLTLRAASTGSIVLNADIRSDAGPSGGLNLVLEAGKDVSFGGSSPFSRTFNLGQGRFDASQVLGTFRVGDGGISPVTINAATIDLRKVEVRNSARLELNGATTIAGDLAMSAGTLAGSGNVLVKGAFTAGVTGGQGQPGFVELAGGVNGESTFTTKGEATVSWGDQDDALFRLGGNRRWVNEGSLRILDSARIVLGGYQQQGNATLENRASGTVSLEGSSQSPIVREDGFGGDALVINRGLLKKLAEASARIELDVNPTPGSVFRNESGGSVRVEQGTLKIDRGDSDAGDYVVASGARLVFAGADRSIGALTLSGGTVELEGSAPRLTVDGSFAASGNAVVKGAGGLLTRAAASVGGSLVFQGPSGPTRTWENRGTLSGAGTIDMGADQLLNKGSIRPGVEGSAGTLTVKGALVLDAAGELRLDIGGPGASDQLAVQGNVTLGGALKSDRIGSYTPTDAQVVRAVTGGGEVSGRFGSVQMGAGLAGFTATYELGDPVRLVHAGTGVRLFTNAAGGRTWHVAGNWQGAQLPGSTEAALLDANEKFPILHGSAAGATLIGGLTLTAGTPLSIEGGSLTVGGTTRLDGSLRVTGDAAATLQGAVQGAQGSLELGSGRTVLLGGAANLGSVTLGSGATLGGTGSLEVSSRFARAETANLGADFSAVTLRQAEGDLSPGALTVAGPIRLTTADANGRLIIDRMVRSTAGTGSITVSAAGDLQVAATADPAGLVAPTQSITVGRDLKLSGGSGSVSPAQIAATGGTASTPATVSIDIEAAGRVELLKGAGGATAILGVAGGAVANGSVRVAAAGGISVGSGAQVGLGPGMTGNLGLALSTSAGNIALDGPVRGGGEVRIVADRSGDSTAGRVSLGSDGLVASAAAGDAIVIAAGQRFSNGGGNQALQASAGRWLVYSRADPDYHDRGGLLFGFKHYGQTYSATSPYAGPGTGNGFLYAVTPVLTPSVSGTAVKTYDRTDSAPTGGFDASASGAVDGDTVVVKAVSARFPGRQAGTALPVEVTVAFDSASQSTAKVYGYTVSPATLTVSGAGEIQPRSLTTTFSGVDKVYDGTTAATVALDDDRLAGDVLTVSYDATFDSRRVGVGRSITVSSIRLTGADAGNYVPGAGSAQTTASITARALTVSGLSAQDKVYDGTTGATLTGTPQLQGVVSGDAVDADLGSVSGAFADRRVGIGKAVTFSGVTLGGADAGNYTLPGTLASTASITARAVSVVDLKAADRVYDGTTAATLTGGGLQGTVSGDAVALDLAAGQASFADRRVGVGKTVTATGLGLSGADAANYQLAAGPAQTTASITARALTVSGLSAQDKVYDGTTGATLTGTPQLQGVVSGDAVDADLGSVSGAFADRRVGIGKAVTFSGVTLGGADAGNYTLPGTLASTASITARAVSVVDLKAADRVYDGTTAATLTGGGLQGAVSGDAVALDLAAGQASFADRRVGAGKTVTATGLGLSGADAANYQLAAGPAQTTASITARALTVSGLSAQDKVYDGTTAATLTGTPVLQGTVSGDAVALDLGGAVARFDDRHVGVARTVGLSGETLAGADAANYRIVGPLSFSASITARTVSITGLSALDRVYDGGTRATLGGGSLQGTITGDAVALDTAASDARFADRTVGVAKAVSVTGLRLAGADAGNYALASDTASLKATITARALNPLFTGQDRVYDGSAAAQVSVSDDRVPGDQLTIGYSAAFPDRHAGVARPIAVSGIALQGPDALNYSAPSAASTSATITVRPLATWTGPAVGDWLNAAHWDALPDRGNVKAVSIPASVEIRYDGSVPVTLATLTNAGTLLLGGAGLQAAQLDNRGRLQIVAGATIDFGGQSVLGAGTLVNEGTLRLNGATVANRLENGGSLELRGSTRVGAIANTGTVTLSGGTTTLEGAYLQRSGITRLEPDAGPGQARLVAPDGVRIEGGRLAGDGAIEGAVVVSGGTLAPGASPGALSIDGSLSLGAASRFAIELGGTASSLHDSVSATGALNLGGTLEASTYQGFRPAPADTFDIMRGASVNGRFAEARTDDPLLLGFNFRNLRIVTPDGSLPLPADRVPLGPAEIAQAQLAGLAAGRKDGADALAEAAANRDAGDAEDGLETVVEGSAGPLSGLSTRRGRRGSGSDADDEQPGEPDVVRRSLVRSLEIPESESLDEVSRAATREVRHVRPSRSRSRGSGC